MNSKTSLYRWLTIAGVLVTSFQILAAATPAEKSATALARRVLGPAAAGFRFEQIPADQGRDVFELDEGNNSVVVRGNTGLSMAFGLNWYLKYYCHCLGVA